MGRQRIPNESVEELREMSWSSYVKSYWWKRKSKSLLDDPDCTCAICGRKRWCGVYVKGKKKGKPKRCDKSRWSVHHRNYRHPGEETEDDLMVLDRCHTFAHDLEQMSSTRGGVFTEMYELFKKRTGWEYEKFNKNN